MEYGRAETLLTWNPCFQALNSINHCGFAAAQCGKAAPFRRFLLILFEAAPQRDYEVKTIAFLTKLFSASRISLAASQQSVATSR